MDPIESSPWFYLLSHGLKLFYRFIQKVSMEFLLVNPVEARVASRDRPRPIPEGKEGIKGTGKETEGREK
jgi:hypothetical protein